VLKKDDFGSIGDDFGAFGRERSGRIKNPVKYNFGDDDSDD